MHIRAEISLSRRQVSVSIKCVTIYSRITYSPLVVSRNPWISHTNKLSYIARTPILSISGLHCGSSFPVSEGFEVYLLKAQIISLCQDKKRERVPTENTIKHGRMISDHHIRWTKQNAFTGIKIRKQYIRSSRFSRVRMCIIIYVIFIRHLK